MRQIETGLIAYDGDEPYVFVSYSHADTVRVEGVLNILQQNGIRFWYDEGIPLEQEWSRSVEEFFKQSRMFLCFLANGVEQRPQVLREIRMAVERYNSSEDYRVLFIFLERMSANVFEGEEFDVIRQFITDVQHLQYDGITEKFVTKLFGRDVFPDDLVREEYLDKWKQRAGRDIGYEIEEAFSDNPYICRTAVPEWDDAGGFYRVRCDQTDPDAVCLICLDNQWCPVEFYGDPEFQEQGIRAPGIAHRQYNYQLRELYRALLHSRQIIVNRAYLFNSRLFGEFYRNPGAEREAFCRLLADGSLLIFLMTESVPYDKEHPPDFAAEYYDLWGDVCAQTDEYCLRMDWQDNATNELRISQLISGRFGNFCLTMRENRQLLEDLETSFCFDEAHREVFEALWKDAQEQIRERGRENDKPYTRELFYQYFIIKDGTEARECLVDPGKPLAPALKEIVDFQYGLNLPEALGVRALYPPYGHLKEFYRSSERLQNKEKEISSDVLIYAVNQFETDFLARQVPMPDGAALTLPDICRLREQSGWQRYMRAVTNGRRRAKRQEVDFSDVAVVWCCYSDWLEEASHIMKDTENEDASGGGNAADSGCDTADKPETTEKSVDGADLTAGDGQTADLDACDEHGNSRNLPEGWYRETGALTIIYSLGSYEIVTVYHGDSPEIEILADPDEIRQLAAGTEASKKDHTVLLTIDYVCTDILRHPTEKNPMVAELRLFEGITKEKLSDVYAALMQQFERKKHRMLTWDGSSAAGIENGSKSETVFEEEEVHFADQLNADRDGEVKDAAAGEKTAGKAEPAAWEGAVGRAEPETGERAEGEETAGKAELAAGKRSVGKACRENAGADEDIRLVYDMSKKCRSPEWKNYVTLMRERPGAFRQDPMLRIETDLAEVCRFERRMREQGKHGQTVGVRYQSDYSILLADLVEEPGEKPHLYERVLPVSTGQAVVCVPVFEGKFVLLKQYRHSMRDVQLAFPRGYGENGLSGMENAKKELSEELGVNVTDICFLGKVVPDSGLTGGAAAVYRCEITEPQFKRDYEGICSMITITRRELEKKISICEITDGYTLAALKLLE